MKYNPEIHHRRSIRLKGYDYSQSGVYFITICTQDRECLFGKIINDEMRLNEIGKIAHQYWKKIEELHDFVKLGAFVVMPNHVHGIIIIENSVGVCHWQTRTEKSHWQTPTCMDIKNIQLPKKGIPSLINHYKGAIIKWTKNNKHKSFSWQRNYYEHILRNEKSWEKIQNYIILNPEQWTEDELFL